ARILRTSTVRRIQGALVFAGRSHEWIIAGTPLPFYRHVVTGACGLDGPSHAAFCRPSANALAPNIGCEVVSQLAELSAVIAEIYDAAIEPALWQRALASICNFVGGKTAALVWHDTAAQQGRAMHIFNDDPHYTRLYFEKYLTMDPFVPAAGLVEAGLVTVQD